MKKTITYILVLALVAMVFVTVPMCASCEEEPPPEPTIDWIVEGNGTYFEITSSNYPNVAMTSSETVTVRLESMPGMIIYQLQSNSTATTTEITLSDLEPSTTYCWYQDGELQVEFTTDSSGSYSYTQDLSEHSILIHKKPTVSSSSSSTSSSFTGGSGTVLDPYQISDVGELQEMNLDLGAHYILINDIDCLVFVTDHTEFNNISLENLKHKVVVDCRNIFNEAKMKDIIYLGLGKPSNE